MCRVAVSFKPQNSYELRFMRFKRFPRFLRFKRFRAIAKLRQDRRPDGRPDNPYMGYSYPIRDLQLDDRSIR